MVKKKKAKTKSKASPRKAIKKKTRKKKLPKKPARRPVSKKKAVKKSTKKAAAKKSVRKAATKKPAATRQEGPKKEVAKKAVMVEPGPPSGSIPPVEEPTRQEEALGIVTHYYSHLSVAVIQVNKGSIRTGDTIHVKGHSTDFTQKVESMEYEHQHVDQASAGQSVGLKVVDHAREHDIVYRAR